LTQEEAKGYYCILIHFKRKEFVKTAEINMKDTLKKRERRNNTILIKY